MTKTLIGLLCGSLTLATAWSLRLSVEAQPRAASAPAYSSNGQLVRPLDYREWVFVTSGLGMTYGPAQEAQRTESQTGAAPPQMFDNVFVTPAAYREFMRSGKWPDKTMFILEIRRGETNVSINNGGRTQGQIVAMEAAVKDTQRFPDGGWGYFAFDSPQGLTETAARLPKNAPCYACHNNNTAVENTFVQFYPTLFDVAKRLGTVKPTYDPSKKP
jgi:hypothetical protein